MTEHVEWVNVNYLGIDTACVIHGTRMPDDQPVEMPLALVIDHHGVQMVVLEGTEDSLRDLLTGLRAALERTAALSERVRGG